jgi:8-oxo-dGTP diphosphatase
VKRVHVAAAVIRDSSGKILIARRADTQHQGAVGIPGGKVEAGESVETALVASCTKSWALSSTSRDR